MRIIVGTFLFLMIAPAFSADSRSTPPAWSWGAGKMQVQFDIDTSNCSRIKIPEGGATTTSGASGEVCPVSTVAHGYYFEKKKQTIYKDPPQYSANKTCWRSYMTNGSWETGGCPSSWTGTKKNPTTGTNWNLYKDVTRLSWNCEPMWHTPGSGTVSLCEETWRFKEFVKFPSTTSYTIDPNKLYMNCCKMKVN